VALRVGDLVPQVPQDSWILGSDADQIIEFPATDILGGPVPKIFLDRLVELAPKSFRLAEGTEKAQVRLPISRLAAAYKLVPQRVEIDEPWMNYTTPLVSEAPEPIPPIAPPVKEGPSLEKFAPPLSKEEPVAKLETKEVPPPVEVKSEPAAVTVDKPAVPAPAVEDKPTDQLATPPVLPPSPVAAPTETPEKTSALPSRRIFSVLPMFRRKAVETPAPAPESLPSAELPPPPQPEAEAPARRPRVELPPPKNLPPVSAEESSPIPQSLRSAPRPPLGAIAASKYAPPVPPAPAIVKESAPTPAPEVASPVAEVKEPTVPTPEPVVSVPTPAPVPVVEAPPPFTPPLAEPIKEPPLVSPVAESSVVSSDTSVAAVPLPPPPLEALKEPVPVPEAPVAVASVPAPEPPVAAPLPPPPPQPAVVMETQTMSVMASGQGGITNQDDLQAIFLTEETLTPERIVELCGGFPGISSCVLSRGASVIAAHNVPDSIDLVSLSAHALEMIRAMRESSAKMGVGAVPAVTIHSEKGPITFFHEDDVCFLVLHKDRGFVPGVREKLQQVVHYLAQARLPKPVSQPSRILEG